MALIQDIQPNRGRQPVPRPLQPLQDRLLEIHHATNLPAMAKRVSSFDIVLPSTHNGRRTRPPTYRPNLRSSTIAIAPPLLTPTATPTAQSPPQALVKQTAASSLARRLLDFAQYPLIAGLALAAAYSVMAGQLGILAFGLIGLIFRVSSRYAFGAALLLLVCVPFFQALHQSGISENCAIYAYELLVVGTVQAVFENFWSRHTV